MAAAMLTLLVTSSFSEDGNALRKQAEAGDAAAQYKLGGMYGKGMDVPQDDAEAVKWYRKSAEQGNVEAQLLLGAMYGKGRGVPQDDAESAKWVRKAAEQGDAKAQSFLGAMYGVGRGVPRDYVQSCFWFSLSASGASGKEYQDALETRDRVAKELTPAEIMEVESKTREWEKTHPR